MRIRDATPADLEAVVEVERLAFGEEAEAELVRELLQDSTAEPVVSLLAEDSGRPVGHILFTRGEITGSDAIEPVEVSILAPLAVVPDAQGQGVGGALVRAGIERLHRERVTIVFVLGHPGYYPRHGFSVAAEHEIFAPYPTDPIEAFMVFEVIPGALQNVTGTVRPCDTFMRPEYWRE